MPFLILDFNLDDLATFTTAVPSVLEEDLITASDDTATALDDTATVSVALEEEEDEDEEDEVLLSLSLSIYQQ